MWKSFFTNGVFPNPGTNFSVVADTGMQVKVKAGAGHINGAICTELSDRVLTVQAADSSDRIDLVVLRLNDNTAYRSIDLYVVKGTAATTPSAPSPTRTGGIYEMVLAQLYVSANSSTITQERITDTRLNTTICGYVNSIDTVNTTDIFNQYQAALDAYLEIVAEALNETLAGNLQNQITSLQNHDYVEVTGNLAAGSTSLTLSNAAITTDSTMDLYTSIFSVNPTEITVATGSVTLTFDAQDTAVSVKGRVS